MKRTALRIAVERILRLEELARTVAGALRNIACTQRMSKGLEDALKGRAAEMEAMLATDDAPAPGLCCPRCHQPATMQHFSENPECGKAAFSVAAMYRASMRKTITRAGGRPKGTCRPHVPSIVHRTGGMPASLDNWCGKCGGHMTRDSEADDWTVSSTA